MDHRTEEYEAMLAEIEDMQADIVHVAPAIQRILENFESTMRTSSKIIADQQEKINVLNHRDYIGQMVLVTASTVAYLVGLWGSRYGCAK